MRGFVRGGREAPREGKESKQAPKWNLSGGTASDSWSLEYTPGQDKAELKRSSHTTLAAFNRLHKGVGGGWSWLLLADSFAIGMLLLGLSGIWSGRAARTAKQMIVSVVGVSAVVLGPALF